MSVTPKFPSVSVPVLSNTTRSSFQAPSNGVRLRISNPFLAAIEVDLEVTKGIAKPSACGQAIMRTEIGRASWRERREERRRPAPGTEDDGHGAGTPVPR